MYPPRYNLPPINPAAFGGLPKEQAQGARPPPSSQGGGQQPIDMNKYLMNKVAEIRQRMGAGDMGALTAISDAAQVPVQQPPMQGPPQRQGMA
jgi:hypothetical protein|tara:strand:- start:245 stop:523 length:279 start_codon:yes stop_codon:yes gene_type:complete